MTATGPALAPLAHPITAKWIVREGWRLDAAPFLSGKVEALQALEKLTTQRLADLTAGREGGIFNGPQFRRVYVDDPKQGVPFIGSSDMLLADLSRLPMLRKKDAESSRLAYLKLREGMTLISCSGTIGRTVYCRKEMDGMWSSQDVLKVVPNPDKIPPGYLSAFLKSRYGAPLVVSGTYGAIIQHIEPEHLRKIPVARVDPLIEWTIHEKINNAGLMRSQASRIITDAENAIDSRLIDKAGKSHKGLCTTVSINDISKRWDAQYHSPIAKGLEAAITSGEHKDIGDLCKEVFMPGIFKRIYVHDLQYGCHYFTGASVYWTEPLSKGILSRRIATENRIIVEEGMILVQAFGQEGGIVARPTYIGKSMGGHCTTHMLARLRADQNIAGYLFAFLSSRSGYMLLSRLTYGGSIPYFTANDIASVPVPLFPDIINEINTRVLKAHSLRDEAYIEEATAIRLLENTIAEAGNG